MDTPEEERARIANKLSWYWDRPAEHDPDFIRNLSKCPICAALVHEWDQQTHREWHLRNLQ